MPVSLKDIAQSLNLSVSTVSRALNNQGRINPQTRGKVLKAMEQMNYRPNEAARALREKSSRTMGVVVPDIGNEFFARLIKGAERAAWQEGYALLVMSSNDEVERERQTLRYMLDKRVSGIVLASVDPQCPSFFAAAEYGIPIAFVDNLPSINASFDSVAVDNRLLAYRLVRKLVELGHRRIALFNGSLSETSAEQRQAGYLQALEEAGLEPIVRDGSFHRDFGKAAMAALLSESKYPTAVFAANNHVAYGTVDALREAGLSVPGDISLCCFDALDSSGLVLPQLTSVNQPAERFGTVAVGILLRKLRNPEEGVYERLLLEPEMQWGASIAPPKDMSGTSRHATKKPTRRDSDMVQQTDAAARRLAKA